MLVYITTTPNQFMPQGLRDHYNTEGTFRDCMTFITLTTYSYIQISGVKPEMQMMYAGSKLTIVNKIGFTKVSSISS